jgi:hypothetical protein
VVSGVALWMEYICLLFHLKKYVDIKMKHKYLLVLPTERKKMGVRVYLALIL